LHYYLATCTRATGDEPGFSAIRDFILQGGDASPFFGTRPSFVDPMRKMPMAKWVHILAASEARDPIVAYVCLFKGPLCPGLEYHLALGKLPWRIAVPRPVWGHAYEYDAQPAIGGKAGRVMPIDVMLV
jgi:hypothetical protein